MNYQERRKIDADTTRRAIVAAAAELMRQEGFEKMTVRGICARAGVTTGAFYHHFTSKEELLVQGFTSLDDYLEELMGERDFPDPLSALEFLFRAFARHTEEMGWRNMALYYTRRLSDPSAALMSPNRFTLRTITACFQALAQDGTLSPRYAPEWTADFCFRHFRGVVIDWILHQGGYPLWPKLEQDYQLFSRALRAS